ncbi:chymotrypsin-like elastase family member 2A [Aplysia californica]|uniref:Chymotrypsin-like elastase family member 2A n=1 Tax=Aplysia californica TaxID=6500 RepID=A0ABM1A8H0_APLCA|nr:chymotrypsin-like elastase family member 2A [Aplysia californica]
MLHKDPRDTCCLFGGRCRRGCTVSEVQFGVQTDCRGTATPRCCINAGPARPAAVTTTTARPPPLSVAQRQGQCGANPVIQPRVVGGAPVSPGNWPWMVRFVFTTNAPQGTCAGVLVDDDTVITVAHCVVGVQPSQMRVFVGDVNVAAFDPDEELVNVLSVELNGNYRRGVRGNDFAVVKLTRRITFTNNKLPACLPDPATPVNLGAQCFVAGWGVDETGQVSQVLRAARVQQMDTTVCSAILSAVSGNPTSTVVPQDVLCTDPTQTQAGACLYDDGGMLACPDRNGRYTLEGLVSEYSCGNVPTVYTRVSNYTEAILARL